MDPEYGYEAGAYSLGTSDNGSKMKIVDIIMIVVFVLSLVLTLSFGGSANDIKKTKDEKTVHASASTYFGILIGACIFYFIYTRNVFYSKGWIATSIYFILCILFTMLGSITSANAQIKADKNTAQQKIVNGWQSVMFVTLAFIFGLPVVRYILKTKELFM